MGYSTYFTLQAYRADTTKLTNNIYSEIAGKIRFAVDTITATNGKKFEYFKEAFEYALDPETGSGEDSCKWYDHETDMVELSKSFKDVIFVLSGAGEESGDIWKKYFLNGKKQIAKARIVIDDFDPKKLRSSIDIL